MGSSQCLLWPSWRPAIAPDSSSSLRNRASIQRASASRGQHDCKGRGAERCIAVKRGGCQSERSTRALTLSTLQRTASKTCLVAAVFCQRCGLLKCRKISALGHYRPLADVGVVFSVNATWWPPNFAREREANRHIQGLAGRDRPRPIQTLIIRPARRSDSSGESVERDVSRPFLRGIRDVAKGF